MTNANKLTKSLKIAAVVEKSDNCKIGNMSATYTPFATCPDTCPMKPATRIDGTFETTEGYCTQGMVSCTMRRLGKTVVSTKATLFQIQKAECSGIEALSGKRPLRLKGAGDTPNDRYARGLAKACKTYSAKHNQPTYTYTHNWRTVKRASFGDISVLASCDAVSDIAAARDRGYATAVIVSHFPAGAKVFEVNGESILPCPNQVAENAGRLFTCEQCMLCANDEMLRARGLTVGFEAHGNKARAMKEELVSIGQ